jgi:uncharacterized protein YukE
MALGRIEPDPGGHETSGSDVGQYDPPSPVFNVGEYDTLEKLIDATQGLITQHGAETAYTERQLFWERPVIPDGAESSLSGNTTAEAWYRLEEQVNTATRKLGEVNKAFDQEIRAVNANLQGAAGDAFYDWARDLLKKSERLHDRLESKQYGTTIGNIGHCIQSFGHKWWEVIRRTVEEWNVATSEAKVLALAQAEAAGTAEEVDAAVEALNKALEDVSQQAYDKIITELQALLSDMGSQYEERGLDLMPLTIASPDEKPSESAPGNGKSYHPAAPFGMPVQGMTGPGLTVPGGFGSGLGDGDGLGGGTGDLGPGSSQGERVMTEGPGDGAPEESGFDRGPGDTALDEAKQRAAGELADVLGDGSGDGSGGGSGIPPSRAPESSSFDGSPGDAALDEAKQRAAGELADLTGGGSGVPSSSDPIGGLSAPAPGTSRGGSGLGGESPAQKALADAKRKALGRIGDLENGLTDPEALHSLDNAGKAIGDEFDKLEPENVALKEAAQDLASDGFDEIEDKATTPAARQALADAEEAFGKAIDDVGGGSPAELLENMTDAGNKVFDNALADSTDPETSDLLRQARDDVMKRIGDLEPDNPLRRLDDELPSTLSGGPDPEASRVLDNAQDVMDTTFDDLIRTETDPEARDALRQAKDAVHEAIEGVEVPTTGGSALGDFLSGGGSGGGGGSGLGGLGEPGSGGEPVRLAQFDTDIAGQRGFTSPSPVEQVPVVSAPVANGLPGGTPTSGIPMGMGGAGGVGGVGGQNTEREPQIWLQADKSAWTDDIDGDGDVLGRTTKA